MVQEFFDADFTLPGDEKVYKGSIYPNSEKKIFILNENPNGTQTWKPIKIIFAKTANGYYTCIECYLFTTNLMQYQYVVNEMYNGYLDSKAENPQFTNLVAEIAFLTHWINPRLFNAKHFLEDDIFYKIELTNGLKHSFNLSEKVMILFEEYSEISTEPYKIHLSQKCSISLISDEKLPRKILFSKFYSFLIFFTLFLRKETVTTVLQFRNENEEMSFLNVNTPIEESPFDILIQFKEISNFQLLVSNYFKETSVYDSIIQLWKQSLTDLEPEIVFLHLTQAMELFHKSFFQNDEDIRLQIFNEVKEFNANLKSTSRWIQILRYYHLCKLTRGSEVNIYLPLSDYDFCLKMTNTRNYYTHYSDINNIWNHAELYQINSLLRMWVRILILHKLGVEIQVLNKKNLKIGLGFARGSNIFENDYSMRYKNYFTNK